MYRNTENGKLGGVCAGIGKYFNIDPVWVRLAIFSPLIFVPISGISHHIYWLNTLGQNLFGVLLVVYMILWFVIPEAKSAREKLEMEGEKVTAKAIAEKNAQQTGEQKAKSSLQSAVAWIGRVAVVMLKLLVALMLFPLVVACIAIIITLIAGVTGIGATLIEFGNLGNLAQIIDSFGAGVPIAAAGVALVPICVIIYLLVVLIMGYRPKWWVLITSFVVWIMLIIALCTTGSKAVLNMSGNEIERIMKSDWDEAALREPLDSTLYEKLLTDPQALDLER
jgi:phage shock protein PspC (stress-responsive transcriptional regulator)